MSLDQFKLSQTGTLLAAVIDDPEAILRMEAVSRLGRPAVEAIGKDVAARVGALDDTQKKLTGRWVREVLATRGWKPARKARVAAGNLFAWGTVYRPVAETSAPAPAVPLAPAERLSVAERVARAQALVRAMPFPIMTVDEFIAERREEAAREMRDE